MHIFAITYPILLECELSRRLSRLYELICLRSLKNDGMNERKYEQVLRVSTKTRQKEAVKNPWMLAIALQLRDQGH